MPAGSASAPLPPLTSLKVALKSLLAVQAIFFHAVIALFNFKLLIFFPPTVSSAVRMWLMMLGIRTSSEFFSLCDVKTIYIVIPNKFSI